MTDKDFLHLSKSELVDIIFEQKKREKEILARLENVEKQLESREIKISRAGSIAEAAVSVNNVFESAQRAADTYLEQVHAKYANIDAVCAKKMKNTELLCKKRIEDTDRLINEKWMNIKTKVDEYVKAHKELETLFK